MLDNRQGWLRRALLILALGPLPVGVLAVCSAYFGILDSDKPGIVTAAFGAIWGLTAGVLRKSLGRAIIGLNAGAALGLSFGAFARPALNEYVLAFLLVLHGALLCALLNFDRRKQDAGLLRGAFAGALAFGALGFSALGVTKLFRPNLLGWTVMSIIPFGLGMFLFLRLIANKPDELPGPALAPSSAPDPSKEEELV